MQLRATRLTAIASAVKRAFNIRSLFAGSVPGVWYDPSDYTTLFQDSAGTTPVTAVEQPVGLMLDKSQGLVLGSELVPSTIPSISGAGWTTNGTSITATSSTASGTIALTASTPSTKFYQVTFTASGLSGATSYMVFSSGVSAVTKRINTAKSYSFIVPGQGTAAFEIAPYEGTAFSVTISNISVKELPGNHAFQATSASRPVLSARYNLLTKTEQFQDAAWSRIGTAPTVTANAAVAPDGTTTADRLAFSVSGIGNRLAQALATSTGAISIQLSVYLRGEVGGETMLVSDGWTISNDFTLTTEWQRFTFTTTGNASSTSFLLYAKTGTPTVYAWGASIVQTAQAPAAYQRVNTATDYATAGFLPYLKFDGVDDSLSTNSISFTATDKMSVFAGVRKLSDAAGGSVFVELSVESGTNAGSFGMFAPVSSTSNYGWRSRGTASFPPLQSSGYVAPITNTLTGLGDISGDLATLRINGAQAAQSINDQGTGNYGNYPLYIGRRNNASLPFNGQLYSLIIVGKAVTAGELSSTEKFVASKTGVTL